MADGKILLFLIQICLLFLNSRTGNIITAHDDFGLTPVDVDIADEIDWRKHPCRRYCKDGERPMECYYTFKLESYYTMSKACYDCPFNITDCFRQHCVPVDGVRRPVQVINRQMPGPPIEVCQGDRIIVDVINLLHSESTTMHWHGQHHVNTPYMDGVPYVSQCPIPPGASFRYDFVATEAGTHFWHSHLGFQRGDGVFGPLIVRVPPSLDWHKNLYDFDDHTIMVIDWIHQLGIDKFLAHHNSNGDNKAPNLLINGLGFDRSHRNNTDKKNETYSSLLFVDTAEMPLATFVVKQNTRHRFRLVNAGFLNCPIEISVDNHTIYVVSSDGRDVEPIEAESLVSYAGERFDFIIEMDQKVDNYWIRFRGLMDCDERFFGAHQAAILRYEGAPNQKPAGKVTYDRVKNTNGLQVNALNEGTEKNTSVSMPMLDSMEKNDESNLRDPDYQFYISYDFYKKDNPNFHRKNFYGFHQVHDAKQRVLTPQLNHITMKLPPFPLLSQRDSIDPTKFCNSSSVQGCDRNYCACTHVLAVKTNSIVELILVDEGVAYDANHPFHLHGYQFRVVAMERVSENITVDQVKKLDAEGRIKRKLNRAPLKDTVTVPDGGYTVLRFHTNNPGLTSIQLDPTSVECTLAAWNYTASMSGYWLFHCHIEFHAEIGMSLVFKVGEHEELPPVPRGFPRCGNWAPMQDEKIDNEINEIDQSNRISEGRMHRSNTTKQALKKEVNDLKGNEILYRQEEFIISKLLPFALKEWKAMSSASSYSFSVPSFYFFLISIILHFSYSYLY